MHSGDFSCLLLVVLLMFCSRFVSYFDSMVISQSTDATQAEKRKEVEAKLAEEEKVRQER